MNLKYTEVPGAALAALMVVCWLAALLAGVARALL